MKLFKFRPWMGHAIFWSWNAFYLIILGFILVEGVFSWLLEGSFFGETPISFAVFAIISMITPVLSIFVGWRILKNDARKLLSYFYGVEVPLLLFCLLRMFMLREISPGVTYLLTLLMLAPGIQLLQLFKPNWGKEGFFKYLYVAGQTLLGILGLYYGIIVLMHVIPMAGGLVKLLIEEGLRDIIRAGFITLVFFFFFALTATLFFVFPFAIVNIYVKAAIRNLRAASSGMQSWFFWGGIIGTFVIVIGLWRIFNPVQPQVEAFQLMKENYASPEDREALYAKRELIREGLLNAYLARSRYLDNLKRSDHLEEFYSGVFGGEDEDYRMIQDFFILLTEPFFYQGDSFHSDRRKAERAYQDFFDTPIQRKEKEPITRSRHATFERVDPRAGLLDQDAERVLLSEQRITVEEHDGWAEIELYEIYENETHFRQEIQYNFELPEGAVLVGMWLSDNDSIPYKYNYKVSTRGAAQEVYNNQVRRRMDPSLLEQVGPRQFRLKAFPILAKTRARRFVDGEDSTPNFHLWLKMKVLNDGSHSWQMPRLLEKRNVFWSGNTKRWLNDVRMVRPAENGWLPFSLPAKNHVLPENLAVQLDSNVLVKASRFVPDYTELKMKGAIVIDGSYSMNESRKDLENSLEWLKEIYDPATTDVFLTGPQAQKFRLGDGISHVALVGWGQSHPLDHLRSFEFQKGAKNYESIVYLTDQGSYELESDSAKTWITSTPLIVWHIDKKLPPSVGDAFLETIQKSGGTAVRSGSELKLALAEIKAQIKEKNLLAFHSGYKWEKLENKEQTVENVPFAPLAARTWIERMTQTIDSEKLSDLDKIHAVAKQNSLVTPYSSMIVLVNDAQWKELQKAENDNDRFKRELEKGEVQTNSGSNPFDVAATPEPEEWLLIIAIALFLSAHLYYKYQERKKTA